MRNTLQELDWRDTWTIFERAEQSLNQGHLAGACLYMRTAIAALWKQVVERNSGQTIAFDPGKSTDISRLQKPMESYVPSYLLSCVRQSWSLASELAHIEKQHGVEPPLDRVMLALRYTCASAAFLASLPRQ